jgi:hypothetical protein
MTPKEKAIELIEKHKMQCRECGENETAKIHSLIAVDEVLEVTGGHINQFYKQVKTELTNL